MRLRAWLAVAFLLMLGMALTGGAAWLRQQWGRSSNPASRLPPKGRRVALEAEDLVARIRAVGTFPLYHSLLGETIMPGLRRALGWKADTPDPFPRLTERGPAALGLYAQGWVSVQPISRTPPEASGVVSRDSGSWRLQASDPGLLSVGAGDDEESASPLPIEALRIFVNPQALAKHPIARLGLTGFLRLVPSDAEGVLRVEGGVLRERWRVRVSPSGPLDVLDPKGENGVPAQGWAFLPGGITAVTWMSLDPGRIRGIRWGRSGASQEGDRPDRLDVFERFLGLPLREELASSIAGPAVFALLGAPLGSSPKALCVLDLAQVDRARRVLDQIAALGVLTGSVEVSTYRGVRIATWLRAARRAGWEPSAAIEGSTLLLSFRRSDLEDAIDRRRAELSSAGTIPHFKEVLERMGRGSWKSVSRTLFVQRFWEELAGVPMTGLSSTPRETRALLRAESSDWILEGEGGAPAVFADPILPCLHRCVQLYRGGIHAGLAVKRPPTLSLITEELEEVNGSARR